MNAHRDFLVVAVSISIACAGCTDHPLRGRKLQSADGKSYLVVDELDGPACKTVTVDGKPWLIPLHKPREVLPGTHEISCAAPIKFVIRAGTIFYFDYWGPGLHAASSGPSIVTKKSRLEMRYNVRALSVDLTVEPHTFTVPRDEVIDTAMNRIFGDCATIRDVEIAYEDFWNYLNGDEEVHDATSKVKVLSVTPIDE